METEIGRVPFQVPRMGCGIALWAGAECTVNRLGDRYLDQIRRTGHQDRLDDMDRFSELGAKAVRFPVLWERVAPEGVANADFGWSDARLARLRELSIRPIVGLLHHGSGPRETHLCDPEFPEKLARYARSVAERYPWVDAYTPVNEPLTTARFSALYGHWYPHRCDIGSFFRALVSQVVGTARAMREIRAINPGAELYQTEDAGHTFATDALDGQARYENDRRWLSLDLLFGRVDRRHPLRQHLEEHGIPASTLDALVAEPCPPDVIGINYYLTSDRFLDERVERYPKWTWGGNGRRAYADVEAVRVLGTGIVGHEALLTRTFERYRRPCAVTEVHAGCHREQQLRWFLEAWHGAEAARRAGADVRAVTLWAAFGTVDWSSLLTEERGDYECGAFDVSGPKPRKTALFRAVRAVAAGIAPDLPAPGLGWWRTPQRFLYPPVGPLAFPEGPSCTARPVIVVGPDELARRIYDACAARGLECEFSTHASVDRIWPSLSTRRPWALVFGVRRRDPSRSSFQCALTGPLSNVRLLLYSTDASSSACYERRSIDASLDRLMDSENGCALWM